MHPTLFKLNAFIASMLAVVGVIVWSTACSYLEQARPSDGPRKTRKRWLVLAAGTAAAAICIVLAAGLSTTAK